MNTNPTRILSRLIHRTDARALLIGGVLCLAGFGIGATLKGGPAAEASAAQQPSPARHRPSLALAYRPGSQAGERRIAAAQKLAREKPNSASSHARLALQMLQRKRETSDSVYLQYAVDAFDAARGIDARNVEVLIVGIMIDQDKHRFAEARDAAKRLIAQRPSDPTGHLLSGDALLELGDYQAATDAYQTALDLRPDLRSYNRAGYLRWLHGDFEGAVEMLELAIDAGSPRDPESIAWCYVDLGNMYAERGDAARALRAVKRAQQLVADYHPSIVLEARAYAMRGERRAAIRLLERAVARLPHVADLLTLGELLSAEGKRDAARERLRQAEKLASSDPRPLSLYYARHDIEAGRSLELAERALRARSNIEAHDAHAMALLRAGKIAEALAAMRRALSLGTPDADFYLHHALVLLMHGDRDAARRSYQHALDLNRLVDPVVAAEVARKLEDA